MKFTIEQEIDELKQVRILADHCNLPLNDIKINIDKRIKILENITSSIGKKALKIRNGTGKQLTKYAKKSERRAERETEKSEEDKKKTQRRRHRN